MIDIKPLSVSQLNAQVAALLANQLPMLRVLGEAQGVKRYASGHVYFTLKDPDASVSCVMFKMRAMLFDRLPREGELIELKARVSLYEPRGDYQLRVDAWQPSGQGALYDAFLQLKAKLSAQGLFATERKRAIPSYVHTIGIVTSLQAAVLRDVVSTLARRAPHVHILVYPSAVQGAGAGAQLAQAVRSASAHAQAQVLLLCRGGGSMEDLWCFNDESLAHAIVDCAMPVISGVGHETDVTLADFAADVRAPTPTAAAELGALPTEHWLKHLRAVHEAMQDVTQLKLAKRSQTLDRIMVQLQKLSPASKLGAQANQLRTLSIRLRHAAQKGVAHRQHRLRLLSQQLPVSGTAMLRQHQATLARLSGGLHAMSPQRVLERGYAVVLDEQGKAMTAPLAAGSRVTLQLAQGSQGAVLQPF